MEFQLDHNVNALCIKLRYGRVSRTIELTDSVYVDMDANDAPLGIESLNADEFLPFCAAMPMLSTSRRTCVNYFGSRLLEALDR